MRGWLWIVCIVTCGCGYHTGGHANTLPSDLRTLYVPAFENRTSTYKIEQRLTAAVVQELVTRTNYHLVNSETERADATLKGTILSTYTTPLTYDSKTGRAASVLVVVNMKVMLTDRDGQSSVSESLLSLSGAVSGHQRFEYFLSGRFSGVRAIVAGLCAYPGL